MTMPVAVVGTAHIHAISPLAMGVSSMDNQQFDRELKYQVSMSIMVPGNRTTNDNLMVNMV